MDEMHRLMLVNSLRNQMPSDRRGRRRKPPVWLDPRGIERQYTRFLRGFVAELETLIRQTLVVELPDLLREAESLRPDSVGVRLDNWPRRVAQLVASMHLTSARRAEATEAAIVATAERVSSFNARERNRIIRSVIGVDVFRAEPWLQTELASWTYENVGLIKSIPEGLLKDVDGIVQRGIRGGRSARDLSKEIYQRFDVTESRANLIARDQIGKLNSNLTQYRQKELGIDEYEWSTSRDERVRETHEVMEGMICRWDDPTVYREPGSNDWKSRSSIGGVELHPGVDYQCRCGASPVMDKLLSELLDE